MYKVVIVEDERLIRQWLQTAIDYNSLGLEVVGVASHGQEGMALIEKLQPDIVLTDITMPIMDAFMMFEATASISYEKVILSGYSDFENAKRAIHYGVQDFISKPIQVQELLDCLQKIVDKLQMNRLETPNWPEGYKELVDCLSQPQSHHILRQVLSWVQLHYREHFTIADIAASLGYSESYLYRIIKEHLSMTLNEYILKYRLKVAVDLMYHQSDLKIYEIAEQVGFSDYKYFRKLFKKQFFLSPREFRARNSVLV